MNNNESRSDVDGFVRTGYVPQKATNESERLGVCPNCGYCPHCGKANGLPQFPLYPTTAPYPYPYMPPVIC